MADPGGWALFIDIDGTLLDMAPTPDAVVVPSGLVQVLAALAQRFQGAVALSTGRRVADADRLFAPLRLVTSGVHGTEVRTCRDAEAAILAPPAPPELVRAVNSAAGLLPGVLVEPKGAGIAVHYRNAPDAGRVLERELARIVAAREGVELRRGRRVIEIVPNGYSKATALKRLMQLPPFHDRRPVKIGDDACDEAALLAAQRMGGFGLRVAGEHFAGARADFDGAASVRSWLRTLADMAPLAGPLQTNAGGDAAIGNAR